MLTCSHLHTFGVKLMALDFFQPWERGSPCSELMHVLGKGLPFLRTGPQPALLSEAFSGSMYWCEDPLNISSDQGPHSTVE